MSTPHPRPFYYLENFQTALEWLRQRYGDLLSGEEVAFMRRFFELPVASAALLVRMVMRKGDVFRTGKLAYTEIGCSIEAAAPLVRLGWLDDRPLLGLADLAVLLKKSELADAFRLTAHERALPKAQILETLGASFVERRTFDAWCPRAAIAGERVYRVCVLELCERLRLMFFGNFDQTWSEFVLADLGIFRYEKVAVPPSARAFQARRHIDDFHRLFRCRERFGNDESCEQVLRDVPARIDDNPWLEARRGKLLFAVGQRYEREGQFAQALALYGECCHPGARLRSIRVLERTGRLTEAAQLATRAEEQPESEAERQLLARVMSRLRRRLGGPATPRRRFDRWLTFELTLEPASEQIRVEEVTRLHLAEPEGPVHYVENTLINSLFGLLCWEVIFLPLPGAFFHEFHAAPADLYSADFYARREHAFEERFAQLASGAYRRTILDTFERKAGIQSAFVYWGMLTRPLLETALDCLPPAHLERCFRRILVDVRTNRAGLPDLIQFWPRERRYRMIEVKGPGDRLQDNQIRWLDYCVSHGMPVSVCHVRWAERAA